MEGCAGGRKPLVGREVGDEVSVNNTELSNGGCGGSGEVEIGSEWGKPADGMSDDSEGETGAPGDRGWEEGGEGMVLEVLVCGRNEVGPRAVNAGDGTCNVGRERPAGVVGSTDVLCGSGRVCLEEDSFSSLS